MPEFKRHTLENGLRVITSENHSSPFAYVTMLYSVGSKHEHPQRTGFAHLFEHLMFSGTKNNPDFDEVLQAAGGENNAFTNADFTQYYDVLPVENMETALYLEADRMHQLNLTEDSLEKERMVIIEEFYETCLNMPYGEVWHHLYGITFQKHSYQWPTIGKSPDHIREATLPEVQSFYHKFYRPGNAILSIVAPMGHEKILHKVNKYFSALVAQDSEETILTEEPPQQSPRILHKEANIPHNALYMAFHIPERTHHHYRIADIITDMLSGGRSSRFYQKLYKGTDVFSSIDAYITGSIDPGLLIIEAKINASYTFEQAEELIWREIKLLKEDPLKKEEVEKFLTIAQSNFYFSETQGLNTAINLAFFEECGDIDLINTELDEYQKIEGDDIVQFVNDYLKFEKANILYLSKKK